MENSFCENIRRFRTARGWSQENFAAEVAKTLAKGKEGHYAKSVSQWENGENYPKTEVCIAIAHLIGISLDELFYKEIQDFKNDCAVQISGQRKFEKCAEQEIEMLYEILQDLHLEKKVATDNSVHEFFCSLVSINSKKDNKTISLSLKIGDTLFEEKVEDPVGYNEPIEKWLQTKVLKYFFKQNLIAFIDVHNAYDAEADESGFIAQIYLTLEDSDIEDLFVERAKRQATEIIEYAKEELTLGGGL
jgi:transcriptional regulator with XRE-family HTH domain